MASACARRGCWSVRELQRWCSPRVAVRLPETAKAFAAKFQSKRECYNFLAAECEVYLPPYGKSSIFSDL